MVEAFSRLDAILVVVIFAGWMVLTWFVTRGERVFGYDTFRDMASAESILRGQLWQDPTLPGLTWWYAPGNPMLIAALARMTGRTVADLYGYSPFWLNWLNPVLLFLLVRSVWGRLTGLVSLPMVGFGSLWWLTHAFVPMPSVQGVSLNLAALLAWRFRPTSRWRWPLITGLLLALSLWHHPLCGVLVFGAITGHGLLGMLQSGPDRFLPLRRAAVAAIAALALASPLLLHLLRLQRNNLAPYRWFAPELHELRFALHSYTPLVIPLGLLGLWLALRNRPSQAWLVAYFAVGLVVQSAGYAAHDWGWQVPYLIPHEFQWHEQLALCIGAAAAVVWLATRVAQRVHDMRRRAVVRVTVLLVMLLLVIGPALTRAGIADLQLLRFDGRWAPTLDLAVWIRGNTPPDAVLACDPDIGYTLAGLTGRRAVALPAGHTNPEADVAERNADLRTLFSTSDPDSFGAAAARCGATHLIMTPPAESWAAARDFFARQPAIERVGQRERVWLAYEIRPSLQSKP